MKIGLVTGEFPPMEGGIGAFTWELALALGNAGQEVHVITNRDARPKTAQHTLRRHLEPVDLEFAQLHPRIGRWRWPSLATIGDVVLRNELEIVNIQYQAAAYNMNSPAINFLPWRLKGVVTTIVTFHDLRVPFLFPKAGRLRTTAVNFMARQAQGAIATNLEDYQVLTSLLTTPVAQIPIGSNINAYTPNHIEIGEIRDQLSLDPGGYLLGYFGFLNESKGADTLLQALSKLDDHFHLVFIGGKTGASDPTNVVFLEQIKNKIAVLNLTDRVHWTGFLSDVRVSTYLHAADMLVMPYRDGASLRRGTLMAALAHGRPLITTTPSETIPELAHGQNVWLIPSGNAAALAEAIETLANQSTLRQMLSEGASKTADNFTWDKIASRTLTFFESLPKTGGVVTQ